MSKHSGYGDIWRKLVRTACASENSAGHVPFFLDSAFLFRKLVLRRGVLQCLGNIYRRKEYSVGEVQ